MPHHPPRHQARAARSAPGVQGRPPRPGAWFRVAVVALVVVLAAIIISRRPAATPSGRAATAEPAPGTAAASLPRLVDIGADTCIPCKAMAPILVELRRQYAGRMQVDFIDVWKNPSAGDPYRISLIPTQVFFDEHGRELYRHEGFFGKDDILRTWKRLGYDFAVPAPATPGS